MPLVDTQELMESTYKQMELATEDVRERFKGVRLIGVHSGKGGVGKTTVAINLAVLLARKKRVGLLDADIDCPNVPQMLGIKEKLGTENGLIKPAERFGLKIVSTALLQGNPEKPLIMRGPMKHHVLMQMLARTEWGLLDYLVMDLPPGTSDVPLSVMQLLKPDGMICVTTPQEVALADAKKSVFMARGIGIGVIGLVENMCGDIFGEGGGENMAKEIGAPFLGHVKLRKEIVKFSEGGTPPVLLSKDVNEEFKNILRVSGLLEL